MGDMSQFYCAIKELCNREGKSMNRVERDLGLPRNAINNYKSGGEPSVYRVKLLAKYFGVSIDYLLGERDEFHDCSVNWLGEWLSDNIELHKKLNSIQNNSQLTNKKSTFVLEKTEFIDVNSIEELMKNSKLYILSVQDENIN